MTFKSSQPKLCYDYKGPSNAMVPHEAPIAHTHPCERAGNERTCLWLQHCWGYSGPGLGKGTHARKSLTTLFKLCPVLAKIPIVTYSSGLTGDINILPLPEELCFLVQLYPGKSRSHPPGRKQVAEKPRALLAKQLPQQQPLRNAIPGPPGCQPPLPEQPALPPQCQKRVTRPSHPTNRPLLREPTAVHCRDTSPKPHTCLSTCKMKGHRRPRSRYLERCTIYVSAVHPRPHPWGAPRLFPLLSELTLKCCNSPKAAHTQPSFPAALL